MVIETPCGYKVVTKDKMAWGELKQLRRLIRSRLIIDPNKQQADKMSGEFLNDSEDKVFDLMVIKIIKDGKEITEKLREEVDTWDGPDGKIVYDTLAELASKAQGITKEEKKI